jgi:hypothetical protein
MVVDDEGEDHVGSRRWTGAAKDDR